MPSVALLPSSSSVAPSCSFAVGKVGELYDHSLRNRMQSKAASHTSTSAHVVARSGAMFIHDRHRHSASCTGLESAQNNKQSLYTLAVVKLRTHCFPVQ